ncbi:MAG: tetratricopeptide repeat protein [Erythrobacter sp.]
MEKRTLNFATVAIAAVMVAGCQSSPLAGWTFKKQDSGRMAANPTVDGLIVMEEGRQYLRQGNISKAVASFQLARLDKSTAAAANNGLAVAYAKLGRPDLAERYFRTAAMLDPAETKYVANLLRLQGNVMLAHRADTVRQLAMAGPAPEATSAPRGDAAPVHRVSHGEFRITTAEPAGVPAMTIEARQAAVKPLAEPTEPEATKVALVDTQKVTKQFEVVFGKWLQK